MIFTKLKYGDKPTAVYVNIQQPDVVLRKNTDDITGESSAHKKNRTLLQLNHSDSQNGSDKRPFQGKNVT